MHYFYKAFVSPAHVRHKMQYCLVHNVHNRGSTTVHCWHCNNIMLGLANVKIALIDDKRTILEQQINRELN